MAETKYIRVEFEAQNGRNHQAELQIEFEEGTPIVAITDYESGDELGTIFLNGSAKDELIAALHQ